MLFSRLFPKQERWIRRRTHPRSTWATSSRRTRTPTEPEDPSPFLWWVEVRLCFSLVLFPSNLACRGLATTARPFCSRATTGASVPRLLSGPPIWLGRTVPRAGSWSRYWFMASANWIHDLYLQPRARTLGLSLFREFMINREDHVVFSLAASEKIYRIVDER